MRCSPIILASSPNFDKRESFISLLIDVQHAVNSRLGSVHWISIANLYNGTGQGDAQYSMLS